MVRVGGRLGLEDTAFNLRLPREARRGSVAGALESVSRWGVESATCLALGGARWLPGPRNEGMTFGLLGLVEVAG